LPYRGWRERELDRNTQFERLTTWARVGFAALCCERLLPAYAGFAQATGWGDAGVLGQALDRVWTAIISGQVIPGEEARVLVEAPPGREPPAFCFADGRGRDLASEATR
jgi:hypothetical protein